MGARFEDGTGEKSTVAREMAEVLSCLCIESVHKNLNVQ